MSVVLYSYFRSSCSWRVRLVLSWKNIEYKYVAVHLLNDGGEQLKDDYAAKNSMRQVPTLEIDGLVLNQSMSICEYLEEAYPDAPVLPKDTATRAQVRAIAQSIVSDIQPVQNLRVLKYVGAEKKMEWGRYWIERGFQGLEKMVAKTAGKYCVGDEVTLADMCLVPQVYNARRFKVDMDQFPLLSRIDATLSELPAFQAAYPDAQPDAPATT